MEEFILYIVIMGVAGIISLAQKAAKKSAQPTTGRPQKRSVFDELLETVEKKIQQAQPPGSKPQPAVQPFAPPVVCPGCHFDNPEKSSFCMNCGTMLELPETSFSEETPGISDEETQWDDHTEEINPLRREPVMSSATATQEPTAAGKLFLTQDALRNAILMKEILDPPPALRD